jgi:hypothetical protein
MRVHTKQEAVKHPEIARKNEATAEKCSRPAQGTGTMPSTPRGPRAALPPAACHCARIPAARAAAATPAADIRPDPEYGQGAPGGVSPGHSIGWRHRSSSSQNNGRNQARACCGFCK